MPKVSVIIPTHNRPELVKEAIRSVLNQTSRDLELIVVDVGLEKRAEEVVRSFNDDRLIYLQTDEEKNGSAARNIGIKMARGEYIAFLDDDDVWLPQKLALQLEKLEDSTSNLGFCFSAVTINSTTSGERSTIVPDGPGNYFENALANFNRFLTVTLVVKKAVFADVGLFDESLPSHQEIDLVIRMAKRYEGWGINEPLVKVNMLDGIKRVGTDLQKKIDGRVKILQKYGPEFSQRRNLLAANYFALAILSRNAGQLPQAQQLAKKAWLAKPKSRYLSHFLFYKFFGLWHPAESLGGRVAKGGAITIVKRFLIKGFQFVETLVIARLLFPEDIGLFALASLFLTMVEIFFQPGLSGALVQSDDKVEDYLNSVWTINILRGIILSLLFLAIAPLGGWFFHNQALVGVIRILGLYYFISYAGNVGMLLVQKELQYNKMFIYDMSGMVAQILITIVAAFFLRSVWALVVGMIAGQLALCVSSYLLHPYRPRLDFRFTGIGRLFKFGKWMSLVGIFGFFVSQGDSLAVGKLLNSSNVAYYQMAFALGALPALEVVSTLSGIFFTLFAKIKGEKERLRSAFLRISRVIFAIMIPASFGLAVLAHDAVRYIYGERWLAMVPILYVIIVYGFISSFDSLFTSLLQGVGKPQTTLVNLMIRALVMFSLIVPLTSHYGAIGAALAITAGMFLSELVLFAKVKREVNFSVGPFAQNAFIPLLSSLTMATLLFFLKRTFPIGGIVGVFGFVILGAIIYLAALLALDRLAQRKFYESFLWIIRNV